MSGGIWTQSDARNTSTRPGVYINFISQAQEAITLGAQGVVAVIGTADWGQVNAVTEITSETDVDNAFGSAGSLNTLVRQALRGGASLVKAYRISLASADAKATLTLNDTASPAAAAVDLEARYEGARANNFYVSIAVNAQDATLKDLTVVESGVTLEVFTFSDNDDLVAKISGNVDGVRGSQYITAAVNGASNRQLANLAATALSGGNSGLSVTATEFSNALAALEVQDWNILVPSDTTDSSIQASVRTYINRVRSEGKLVTAVMGGISVAGMSSASVLSELTTIKNRATSTSTGNHEGIVYVFPGIVDELSGTSLSGAQTAARVAGMIGRAGFASSITKRPTGANETTARLTNADIKSALQAGVCLVTTQGNSAVVEQGLNSLTTFTTTKGRDFRKIRVVRALDAVAQTIDTAVNAFVIGAVNNDDNGQAYTISLIKSALEIFQGAGAIEPGFTVARSTATADSDEFYVDVALTPIDSIEKVFITARVL